MFPYADAVRRPKVVVELFQCLSGALIIANLDKLYAELAQRHVPCIQTTSRVNDHLSGIVGWTHSQFVLLKGIEPDRLLTRDTVRDYENIDGLVVDGRVLNPRNVDIQNMLQLGAERCLTCCDVNKER